MRIPLGNFGNAIPDAAPVVRDSTGQGLEKLGNTGMSVASDLMTQQEELDRVKAATAAEDYAYRLKAGIQALNPSIADGSISSGDAPAALQKIISETPPPQYDGYNPQIQAAVNYHVKLTQDNARLDFQNTIQSAVKLEQNSTLVAGMDTIGKNAGLPNADVAGELAKLDAYDPQGTSVAGKNWPKIKQDFIDKTYHDVAAANIERNSFSMTALQAIQSDLEDPNGSYAGHLDTQARTQLLSKVEEQIHAAVIDTNNAQVIANREKAQQQDLIMQGYLIRSTAGTLTAGEVQKNPFLDFPQKYEMTRIIEAQSNKMDRTNPRVFSDLFQRIHSDGPNTITSPDQLYPYVGKGLSVTDMGRLRAEVDGKNQPESGMLTKFKAMAKDMIEKSTLGIGPDPVGEKNFYEWNAYFEQQLAAQRKAGIPAHDLLDPTSKNYLGPTINRFVRTPQQVITDIARGMNATTPSSVVVQRKPGESPDDYLKRIGSR